MQFVSERKMQDQNQPFIPKGESQAFSFFRCMKCQIVKRTRVGGEALELCPMTDDYMRSGFS